MTTQMLNTKKAAKHLGVAAATLQYWRSTSSQQVPFIKAGGCVFYRMSDLDQWLSERTYSHTGEYPTK